VRTSILPQLLKAEAEVLRHIERALRVGELGRALAEGASLSRDEAVLGASDPGASTSSAAVESSFASLAAQRTG
jgi:hypothetical protein